MREKPFTHKACTTTCPPGCAYNLANHISHEHFIAACSALVIALAGVIMTISPVDAAPPVLVEARYEVICRDTDSGLIPEQRGTAMLLNFNTHNRSVKRLSVETDSCANPRTVVEYACGNNGAAITKQQLRCNTNEVCANGACVARTKPQPSNTTSTPTEELMLWPSNPSPNPIAFCALSGIAGGDNTVVRSPLVGRGYAQARKENITNFTDLLAGCSSEDFNKLKRQYCAFPNQPPFQKTAILYDSRGQFMEFGGCEKFGGCQLHSCSDNSLLSIPTSTELKQTTKTCSDSDDGLNIDVAGKTIQQHSIAARTISNDYCLSPDTVVEHTCYTENGETTIAPAQIPCESGICSNGACVTLTSS